MREGAVFPLRVQTAEDRIDDPVHALHVEEADHGPGSAANLRCLGLAVLPSSGCFFLWQLFQGHNTGVRGRFVVQFAIQGFMLNRCSTLAPLAGPEMRAIAEFGGGTVAEEKRAFVDRRSMDRRRSSEGYRGQEKRRGNDRRYGIDRRETKQEKE